MQFWFPPHYKSRKRTGRLRITHRSLVLHEGFMDNRLVDLVLVQVEYECVVVEGTDPVLVWEDARPNDILQREIKLEDHK